MHRRIPSIQVKELNRVILFIWLVLAGSLSGALAQEQKFLDDFRGTASITNNGISLVPSFSLGDPALIFDLKFTKGRLSFEPDMRFALEGKPWTFIFWFRYKVLREGRFTLRVGAHPAINFRTVEILRNDQPEELLEARRYLASEIVPSYRITDKISIGMYYLFGQGFDAGVKNTHFVTFNSSFNDIPLTSSLYLDLSPQVYYLAQDELQGVYAVGYITLAKRNFPFSVSAIFNKALDTQIQPEEDFIWSILLNYRFPNRN